jgi:hypothetical protein
VQRVQEGGEDRGGEGALCVCHVHSASGVVVCGWPCGVVQVIDPHVGNCVQEYARCGGSEVPCLSCSLSFDELVSNTCYSVCVCVCACVCACFHI